MREFSKPLTSIVACVTIWVASLSTVLGEVTIKLELGDPLPVAISLVPEAQHFAELDWPTPPDDFNAKAATKQANTAWKTEQSSIAKILTPDVARALSRWARKEMAGYTKASLPANIEWEVVGYQAKHHRALLETTVETLPAHSPLVTRWLKLYLVMDTESGKIIQAIVTIQGQVLE